MTTVPESRGRFGTVNKQILVSAVVIGGLTAWQAMRTRKGGVSRVILGTFVFVVALSIIDLFGGAASDVAGALAMLAMVAVLGAVLGPVLMELVGALRKQS